MKNWKYIEGAKTGNYFGNHLLSWSEKALIAKGQYEDAKNPKEKQYIKEYAQRDYQWLKNNMSRVKDPEELKDIQKAISVYQKIGNETLHEYATSKPRVINEDKTGAEEFFKQLSDDVKEREKKDDADIEKVGNSLIGKTVWVKKSDGHQYKATVLREDGGRVYVNTGDGDQFWRLKHEIEVINKVGNKVVWKEGPYRIEEVEKDGKFGFYNIPKGSFNAYRNSVLYGNFKTLDSAKAKMNEEIRLDKEYKRKYTTNSKTGNATYTEADRKRLYELARKRNKTAQEWAEFDELNRREEQASRELIKKIGKPKTGNSAQDDKFAYVMREFNEGKLKTPDGKVVTDPAQAKAIAYSESKKTENGLARARNAMAKNKKVKNSAVREYKHSDGRVAQIDFNEDGSDADMSIYEGTKEIEQRNFSTIRDAEQYVTSHGFRRIL